MQALSKTRSMGLRDTSPSVRSSSRWDIESRSVPAEREVERQGGGSHEDKGVAHPRPYPATIEHDQHNTQHADSNR